MGDDDHLRLELERGPYYSSPRARIVREYDFFSEASKHQHVLPIPQNLVVLRQFFVPELINGVPPTGPVFPHQDQTTTTSTSTSTNPTTSLRGNPNVQAKGKEKMEEEEEESGINQSCSYGGGIVIKEEKIEEWSGINEGSSFSFGGIVVKEKKNTVNNVPPLPNVDEERPVFLFEKVLEISDIHMTGLDWRLLILESERVMSFLSEGERRKLEEGGFVSVILSEAKKPELKLLLGKLDANVLILRENWWRVLNEQRLKRGDLVRGWGFRRHNDQIFRLKLTFTSSQCLD